MAKISANGAIDAAGAIGNTAGKVAKNMLVDVVAGAKKIADAALPKAKKLSHDRLGGFEADKFVVKRHPESYCEYVLL